jgi:hypothetical protein
MLQRENHESALQAGAADGGAVGVDEDGALGGVAVSVGEHLIHGFTPDPKGRSRSPEVLL